MKLKACERVEEQSSRRLIRKKDRAKKYSGFFSVICTTHKIDVIFIYKAYPLWAEIEHAANLEECRV
jgi:hypothetical protein